MPKLESPTYDRLSSFDWEGAEHCADVQTKHRAGDFSYGHSQNPSESSARSKAEIIKAIKERIAQKRANLVKARDNEARLRELERRIESQEQIIADIQQMLTPPDIGDFEVWFTSEDAKQYEGKCVAFKEGRGVIEVADSIDELSEKLPKDRKKGEIILAFVPNGSF